MFWLLELLANLPSAGNRNNFDGSMNDVGSWGDVWASSVDGSNSHNVNFDSDNADWTLYHIRSAVNSYLGTLIHFSSFKLRAKVLAGFDDVFYHYFMLDKNLSNVVLKHYY